MAKWGEVVDITEVRLPTPTGEIGTFYRYRAKTARGVIFTEVIPEADTDPETVSAILSRKAEKLDKSLAL